MNNISNMIKKNFDFEKEELDTKIFNVELFCIIGLLMGNSLISLFSGVNSLLIIVNSIVILLLVMLLIIGNATGKIKHMSVVTCIIMNIIVIVYTLYSEVGSSLYYYLVLSLLFTNLAFRKRLKIVMITIEVVMYVFLISHTELGLISTLSNPNILFITNVSNNNNLDYIMTLSEFLFTVISLGFCYSIVFNAYEKQNKKLQDLNDYLHTENLTDHLTNTWNRKYMERLFKKLIDEKQSFSIIMFDIDKFKDVNDKYGHLVGDEILINLVHSINTEIMGVGKLVRYGGEEFIIILPDYNHIEAYNLADDIRKKMSKRIKIKGTNKYITISGGIAEYSGQTMEQLIEKADDKLYKAKENGRNKIVK